MAALLLAAVVWGGGGPLAAAQAGGSGSPAGNPSAERGGQREPGDTAPDRDAAGGRLFIREYRVTGAHLLPRIEVEAAVYPFLGPDRTRQDIEAARAALEQRYRDQGFQTTVVNIPPQEIKAGVVTLQVVETAVGRLRVTGARYFSPAAIKAMAPSLAEGKVVNFNEVPRDIVALNQLPERRVTPVLHNGATPGTVDIDLEVKDSSPVHGSLELNNRASANTAPLRLNGSVSDNNLGQLGHSFGLSFQLAPQHADDAKVFSAYYLARPAGTPELSFLFQGTKQDSNVSTLGSIAVAGRGETFGTRAIMTLPGGKEFFQSASLGLDYKHFDQKVTLGGAGETTTPITYYPLSVSYNGSLTGKGSVTEFTFGATLHLRGVGSRPGGFADNRYNADGSFVYFHGDLSHTHDLPLGFQVFGRIQGQLADQPLLNSEQFSGGGMGTVRGYLEAETVGDNGVFTTLEFRSPSLAGWLGEKKGDWRVYAFGDGGGLTLIDALPGQAARFTLAGYGLGTRFQLRDHFSGSIDAAMPLTSQSKTKANELRLTFRAATEF